ncbi:NucA/NucB deoxyribonuclease domain-containing protein [Actinokineospora sp.]|uniref:NucA/NucB deoxyribonuclease domain-containing protein n=1 Tax=Actinokineospora sp. TaxID=1872133 RepID=UPI0040383F76
MAVDVPILGGIVAQAPSVIELFQPNMNYAVAPGANPLVKQCAPTQILNDKKCDKYKIVIIDARKMSYIARNIQTAWLDGKAFILHKDSIGRDSRYTEVCKRNFTKKYENGSCDEYPFASSQEGGKGARTEEVHPDEQNCQGGTLSTSYRYQNIKDGEAYLVVISNPDQIAKQPWQGQAVRPIQC